MKKKINLILLILWMIFIFIMSSFNSNDSSSQSGFIVSILNYIFKIDNLELLSFIIRKLAHITEYLILGILMINCLKDYRIKNLFIVSILLCILYSCTDEIHQLFVSGRCGSVIDVMIDSFGIILSISIYKLIKNKVYRIE